MSINAFNIIQQYLEENKIKYTLIYGHAGFDIGSVRIVINGASVTISAYTGRAKASDGRLSPDMNYEVVEMDIGDPNLFNEISSIIKSNKEQE